MQVFYHEDVENRHPSLQQFFEAFYPQQAIQWSEEPNFKEIDTYVLFYSCAYGVEEEEILHEAMQHAQQILASQGLKPEAHILIIVYRDLKVAFPERKLQREKIMSEMATEEILHREAPREKNRIHVNHVFGTNDLQVTLQEITGQYIYFEVIDLKRK